MQSEMEVAQQIEEILANSTTEVSLMDVVKQAVPELTEDSISQYFSFVVNGKPIHDSAFMVSQHDVVKVIPKFAGGY